MTEFEAWASGSYIDEDDWNPLLAHGLTKTGTYIIRPNGSYYEAINGLTGKITYGGEDDVGGADGTDADDVINNAILQGGSIFLKKATYPINTTLTPIDNQLITAELGTILEMGASIQAFEINAHENVTIENLIIDGKKGTVASWGIYVTSSSRHVTIRKCILQNFFYEAILFENSHWCNVYDNKITNADYGIRLFDGSVENYIFANSLIESCVNDGIRITDSDRNYFMRNLLRNNSGYGIAESGTSDDNYMVFNTFRLNTLGPVLRAGANTFIENNYGNVSPYQTQTGAWANPTGTPSNGTKVIVYNSTAGQHRLYCYSNGAWHYIALT